MMEVISHDDFRSAWWGIHVVDLASGTSVVTHNVERAFMPASNVKLFTGAGALLLLGPDHQFRTTLHAVGPREGDTLQGSLVVQGGGDPTIGGRLFEQMPYHVFDAWHGALRANGIARVTGGIAADVSYFDPTPLGRGWAWDDPPARYSAEVGPLSFHENMVELQFEGTRPGQPARLTWRPATSYLRVQNNTTTVPADSSVQHNVRRSPSGNTFTVASRIPAGRSVTRPVSIHDPAAFFTWAFREHLRGRGLSVAGPAGGVLPAGFATTLAATPPIAVHHSPPVRDIVQELMKDSQNLYAEALLRSIGAAFPRAEDGTPRSSAAAGAAAVLDTLAALQVDTAAVRLVDGSGLSRRNLVPPAALTSLLRVMHQLDDPAVRVAFAASLPRAGREGTLQYRMTRGRARGNARGKTGTLSHASALSGYVTTANGRPLAFALMANHHTVPTRRVRQAQDALVEQLARYTMP
jgi:D-alanyl-D-alanine carboxypeptidase/D-alanyl-D-alanine-endopeptidase (penicillin-binding protein 4)